MQSDIHVTGVQLYFLPVHMRLPLKFGSQTLTQITCARVAMRVDDAQGKTAIGWGETPLSVQWVWPSNTSYDLRHEALKQFCIDLAEAWCNFSVSGHPMEIGHAFMQTSLLQLQEKTNSKLSEPMPHLAALVACSAFDLALHDAFGILHNVPTYETYNAKFMNKDLGHFITPAADANVNFAGKYPSDFLLEKPLQSLPVWHLVGGLDALDASELNGDEPRDGYPVHLEEWIERDGLQCLKIKLRGNDAAWDLQRIIRIGAIAKKMQLPWFTTDFNCTVTDPQYVLDILDAIAKHDHALLEKILYIEQPFPYDLHANQIDVRSVSKRKPLYLDESSHDWELIRLGRKLGWTGVALKTCKTQTGVLLSYCWAKAHGMGIMVQDLTNPMLAAISHCQLAAHTQTLMGIESNAMQFYPRASDAEAALHIGVYQRRHGKLDLHTLGGAGLGYRIEKINRVLPGPIVDHM